MEKVVINFINMRDQENVELEIPNNITANDLIVSLNRIYDLQMDVENIFNCYLVSEDPIAFIHGNKLLNEFGIRNGSKIIYQNKTV